MKTLKQASVTYILLAFIVMIHLNSEAKIPFDCTDIETIKTEVTSTYGINKSNGKLQLFIPEGSNIENFKIHLFAPLKSNNRLDIKAKVIDGLSKGRYYLIVQTVNGDCTRKISIEIN